MLKEFYLKYKNFKITIDFTNESTIVLLKTYEIPFFFSNPVTTIDQLHGFMTYKPTDIYVCEELCFSLDKISKLLHKNNIKVRVYPNICQSSFPETPSLKTFFILPEDIDVYSQYVDIFELITDNKREEVIFKIYNQREWIGYIHELIPTFKAIVDTKFLLPHFGGIRSKCRKRCMYDPDSCTICERFVDISEILS